MTIEDRFREFDAANPHVYALFRRFAYELLSAGVTRISSKAIIERIRWESRIATTGAGWHVARGKKFLIDNRFTAHYARKFATEFPRLANRLEMRKMKVP